MTLDNLRSLMEQCTGVDDDAADLGGDIIDQLFDEIGYDSLARLEIVSHLQREYGLQVPDEAIEDLQTPRSMIDYVNAHLATAAG